MKGDLLKLPILVLITTSIVITINACKHETILIDKGALPDSTIHFTSQVLPIFQSNCATSNCHQGNGT